MQNGLIFSQIWSADRVNTNRDIEATVKATMVDILGIEADTINADTARDNTPGWDSANHLTMMLALEEEFGITFQVSELESMFTYADIIQCLESHLS
jgi:acyl carrier protein